LPYPPCLALYQGGEDWHTVFPKIEHIKARLLVVAVSDAYYESKHCLEEAYAALKAGIKVLPVRMGDITVPEAKQWKDLTSPHWKEIIHSVKSKLGRVNCTPSRGTIFVAPGALRDLADRVEDLVENDSEQFCIMKKCPDDTRERERG
jgi:hypothetical protein